MNFSNLKSEPVQYKYELAINLYIEPPSGQVSVQEAQDFIEERLKIFQILDQPGALSSAWRDDNVYGKLHSELHNLETKCGKSFYYWARKSLNEKDETNYKKVQEALRRDHVSHFLLCLYYCRNEELRKWFIQKECDLLKFRLNDEKYGGILDKLLKSHFNFEEIFDPKKTELFKNNKVNWRTQLMHTNKHVYKFPFEQVPDLVRSRIPYLEKGFAYVMGEDTVSIVLNWFRAHLSESLAIMRLELPSIHEERDRLVPRFNQLHKNIIESKKVKKDEFGRDIITPDMIDNLAKTSFPPCMRSIHETVRRDHHLKHYGRLHYGLFLKSIGLTMEGALNFFRDEFTKNITPEKFEREYGYNIRYNYGKEGKRVNMSAYSCSKIINGNPPGPSETHGCPFRHFDEKNLTKFLKRCEISDTDSDLILNEVKEKNYMIACSKFFSCKHPSYPPLPQHIYHPNQYYQESKKALNNQFVLPTPPASNEEEMVFDEREDSQIMEQLSQDFESQNNQEMEKMQEELTTQHQNIEESQKMEENQDIEEEKMEECDNIEKEQSLEDGKNIEESEDMTECQNVEKNIDNSQNIEGEYNQQE